MQGRTETQWGAEFIIHAPKYPFVCMTSTDTHSLHYLQIESQLPLPLQEEIFLLPCLLSGSS